MRTREKVHLANKQLVHNQLPTKYLAEGHAHTIKSQNAFHPSGTTTKLVVL